MSRIVELAAVLAAGLLFGLGLAISGMWDPGKVLAFLDVAGAWNPRLLFVLGGAVIVAFVGYRMVLRRAAPLLAAQFNLPASTRIDARLLIGAALFGVGWGLAGFCPGPIFASFGVHPWTSLVFLAAMVAGAKAADRVARHVWLLRSDR